MTDIFIDLVLLVWFLGFVKLYNDTAPVHERMIRVTGSRWVLMETKLWRG